MKTNAVDLSAKLLATENITVVRSRVRTASFDIKSRVLTLPQWKEMSPMVEGMLVGHEVGHALYTDETYHEPIIENRKMMTYMNVLEDVRIEKLIKRKYPGIRKTMNEGYKQLNEQDFFGVAKMPSLETLNLIDRINLYFKAGYSCGVEFNSEEKVFVLRAERTETPEEVIALAKEVYAFSKEQAQKRAEERKKNKTELDQEDDDQELLEDMEEIDSDFMDDSDMDDSEEGETDKEDKGFDTYDEPEAGSGRTELTQDEKDELLKQKMEQEVEEELEVKTEKVFSEKLQELADENTEYHYYQLDEQYVFDPIVGFKRILAETKSVDENLNEYSKKDYEKFNLESGRVVNYLIKEFEMRKSATLYKRAQTAKIGSLDMKKVWSYKLNDDLFKRVMTMPKGKNHGMIFLLDWSGSMDAVLDDTIKQVISLAMFCQRAQIPYQVFAFSSQYQVCKSDEMQMKMRDKRQAYYSQDKFLSNATTDFALLEFFSSKMSNVEFNTMVRRLINHRNLRYIDSNDYGTGGTPLNEALAYMVNYIGKFISANSIEKMSLITLTDGEGGALQGGTRYSLEDFRVDYAPEYKRIQQKHFLLDPVTKKSYSLNRYSSYQTEAILRMIKDRYNVNSVGFYICRNARRDLAQAVKTNIPGFTGSEYNMVDIMRREFRENGFASIKNTGRDDLFIVPQNKLIVEDGEMVVDETQNARQIARNFSKMMAGRKTSRVLLNQFIGYVA